MYWHPERDNTYRARLGAFVRRAYGIEVTAITPAHRGYYGETWRFDTVDQAYFVKVDYSATHQGDFERGLAVIEYLGAHGIDFIPPVVPARDAGLSQRFDDAVVGVFRWVDGHNVESDETKAQEFALLARVYKVPSDGLVIGRETFAGDTASMFFRAWDGLRDDQLRLLFERHGDALRSRAERLSHFAAICQGDESGFFITHGDAGGNLLLDGDRSYIVDWDEALLAPPERDAWVWACYRPWAGDLFQSCLHEQSIDYVLRPERLAYYCYSFYFQWLCEYLNEIERPGISSYVERYFDDWAEIRIRYADECLLADEIKPRRSRIIRGDLPIAEHVDDYLYLTGRTPLTIDPKGLG